MARALLFIYVVSVIRVFNSVKKRFSYFLNPQLLKKIWNILLQCRHYMQHLTLILTRKNPLKNTNIKFYFSTGNRPPPSWNIQNRNHSLESLRQKKYETNIIIIFINYSRCKKSLCWTNIFIFPAYMRLFSRWNTASQKKEWGLCCKTCME